MYRGLVGLLLLAVVFVIGSSAVITTRAQEATPVGVELAPGVTAEVFSGIPSDRAPGQTLYLARFTFQPDMGIFPHGHPGTTSLTIDSGTLGWTLLQGEAHVIRGAATGGTEVEDVIEPNTEVLLEPGDAIYYEDDVIHTARGAADEPTVVLASLLLEAGQPLLMPADMDMSAEATPSS